MRKRYLFSVAILFLAVGMLPAQNPYIQCYTTHDGLPSNCIYYIYQDSKNFIWFATDAGVSRYDGTSFTNYRKKDGLSSNEVIRMKEDSFGRIWLFNLNGRLDYFFQNKIFNQTEDPVLKSIKNRNFFIDFFQDKDSVIYFYNWKSEIFSLSPQKRVEKIEIIQEFINRQSKSIDGELSLKFLSRNVQGEFILWTRVGIFKMNGIFRNQVKVSDLAEIYRVFPNRNKSYDVVTDKNKIVRFNDKIQPKDSIPFQTTPGFGGIRSLLEDTEGVVWIVTYEYGVFCLQHNKVVRHFNIKSGQAIIQDNENNIWISSMKEGLYKINPNINGARHFENSLFQNTGITAMNTKKGWGLWLTNGKTIYLFKNNDFYPLDFRDDNTTFNLICQFKNKNLIAGESGLNLFVFEGIDSVPAGKKIHFRRCSNNYPNDIQRRRNIVFKKLSINKAGDEICSFRSGSLLRSGINSMFSDVRETIIGEQVFNAFYDVNEDIIINAKKNYIFRNNTLSDCNELSRFDNKIITDHLILNSTTELYNIDGDSIFLYNRQRFFNLTAAFDSPIDVQVKKICYHAPYLYLATDKNIFRCDHPLNVTEHKPVQLQRADVSFLNIHDLLTSDDSLYIASDDGLTIIPEILFRKIPAYKPVPYFRSIKVNDLETDPLTKELTVQTNNKITFTFSCICFSAIPIIYSYRLAGYDTSWTNGTSRNVVYQKLGRGNYVFELRVRKPSEDWSITIERRIVVKAVFWQHPLFYFGLSVLLMGFLVLLILRRKNNQMKRREIDHQLITLEQKALQSMMNPHFIFNALGSIQNYLLQKKSGEAALYLSQFARLIRQNLNAIVSANINLEEEVDRLKNYLDLEMLRMENKFEYHIDVDENLEADEIMIPSMLIQPFVENAIWHGIATLEEKGEITIKFRKMDEKSLKIIIRDNGIGMQKSAATAPKSKQHVHLGMEMTHRRLQLLGEKYSIDTSIEHCEVYPGMPNPGTRVVLVVPIGL